MKKKILVYSTLIEIKQQYCEYEYVAWIQLLQSEKFPNLKKKSTNWNVKFYPLQMLTFTLPSKFWSIL